jgi:putative transposase
MAKSPVINLHHMVFCPKYRRNIFADRPALAADCARRMQQICNSKSITVHAIAIEADHVHVFVEIPATMAVAKAAMLIKWFSSKHLRKQYPELKQSVKATALWQRRYFSKSVSGSTATIKKYIQDQGVTNV